MEEKINISATKKDVTKNVIALFKANVEELKIDDKRLTYEEFSVCYKTIAELYNNEMAESLYLRDSIKYIGKVKRKGNI